MNLGGKGAGTAHGAYVGGHHHEVVVVILVLGELIEEIIDKGGVAQQMVQRNVKEALNLRGMEVHGQHPVGTGGGDHVGNQLGGDGIPALGLPILTGVTKVGNHSGDSAGGSTAAGIAHNEQFHEIVVYGLTGGLNQENIGSADGFQQADGSFAVSKGFHLSPAQLNAQVLADTLGEFAIGVAAENLDILSVRNHQ